MHWRISRDPYLRALAHARGEPAVWESGFFIEDAPGSLPDDDGEDLDLLCTPRPKREITGDRPVVLLSTGGFCPPHAGHLAMMECARVAASHAGYDVIGGYLSPGHDAYITMKCGAAAMPASERLRLCAEAVTGSDWLSVDPWESLHQRLAVNFTAVAARLRAYLRAHVDPRVEVLYVCGGDNARFALAFAEEGGCVVVGRPGNGAVMNHWRARLADNARVLWIDGDHPAASRDLRASSWSAPPRRLVVRLEDDRAVRTLGLRTFARFQRELLEELARHISVRTVSLDATAPDDDVISLDAMRSARVNLSLSRLYSVGGYEPLGHIARPGAPPLASQIAAITPGEYALEDDDRMSGATLAAARSLLSSRVRVREVRLAVDHADDEDVADSRDFLLGADDGGLVLSLPHGSVGRAPYLLPYVDPAVRSSVPSSRAFSIAVWELNAKHFADTSLRVADLPPSTRATFAFMGDDTRLFDVCARHAERLRDPRAHLTVKP